MNTDKATPELFASLAKAQAEVGNKWAAIAARRPGRPETAVKNTFYAAVRREERRAACAAAGQPIPPPFVHAPRARLRALTMEEF